jgi:hypothetical protein
MELMIVKEGSTYSVKSESGKNLGSGYTKEQAKKRLALIEYFKSKKEKK